MALQGNVQSASAGLLGFDANTPIRAALAAQFVQQGFKFCIRYLSRTTQGPNDLSVDEAGEILDSGMALMPVQHVRKAGWTPTSSTGTQDGQAAAQNATTIGFPPGTNVWCDLEGVAPGTNPQDVIDYANSWFDQVAAAGFLPGIYVGAGTLLTEQQLSNLKFEHYWRSQSNVPNTHRGYQLIQLYPETTVNGIGIDFNITQKNYRGGQTKWLASPTSGVAFSFAASAGGDQ